MCGHKQSPTKSSYGNQGMVTKDICDLSRVLLRFGEAIFIKSMLFKPSCIDLSSLWISKNDFNNF